MRVEGVSGITIEEISKFASEGKKPAGMTAAERCLFYELKELYRGFREGKVTKGEGEMRKKEAIRQYNADCSEFMSAKEVSEWHAKFWRKIEEAGSDYAKNPSIEKADAFFKAVYGAGRKDDMG